MPELPDITLYVEHLERRLVRKRLQAARVVGPNLLRTVDPPLEAAFGLGVVTVSRLGKRVVIGLEGELHLVIHLMIAGRLHWADTPATNSTPSSQAALRPGAKPTARPGKLERASF